MESISIQTASKLSGVSTHTIRAWEKRYQAIVPERSETGRRCYTHHDVERLTLLSQLTNFGDSISEIAKLPTEELKEMLGEILATQQKAQDGLKVIQSFSKEEAMQTLENLRMGLRFHKLDIISHEISKVKSHVSPKVLALDILAPFFSDIQKMVRDKELGSANLLALSAVIKFHIKQVIYSFKNRLPEDASRVALVVPDHDLHQFGLMLTALLCCHHQLDFVYLGTDLGPEALAEAVEGENIQTIFLGKGGSRDQLDFKDYIAQLSERLKKQSKLYLVGQQEMHFGQLEHIRSIDCFEDLQSVEQKLGEIINQ